MRAKPQVNEAGFAEAVPEDPGGVLAAAVGVDHGPGLGAAAPDGNLQGDEDQLVTECGALQRLPRGASRDDQADIDELIDGNATSAQLALKGRT